MPDALLLAVALFGNVVGLAWLALAMEAHWHQVHGRRHLRPATAIALRLLGSGALLASLLLCLAADHASMAVLVWVMSLAAAALLVAFAFTWRPRLFVPLLILARRDRSEPA